jgi:hypothetical protein
MQEPWDTRQYPLLRNARLAPAESAWLRSSLRSSHWCTFGYVLVSKMHLFPRWVQCSKWFGANENIFSVGVRGRARFRLYTLDVAARSRELHQDWRNHCHGFSVLFVQETVSRNALSCNASTSCRMPQSNASNCSAESSTGGSSGQWRRILPTRT